MFIVTWGSNLKFALQYLHISFAASLVLCHISGSVPVVD